MIFTFYVNDFHFLYKAEVQQDVTETDLNCGKRTVCMVSPLHDTQWLTEHINQSSKYALTIRSLNPQFTTTGSNMSL